MISSGASTPPEVPDARAKTHTNALTPTSPTTDAVGIRPCSRSAITS
jgi:hypothetical protein